MKYLYFLSMFFLGFSVVSAQVEIVEIMYDLPRDSGLDSGREWVEILNTGSKSVDMTGWKFFEAEQNHKLKIFQGDVSLPAGSVAVIADNPTKFLADWNGFSGAIFDSAFSLKNKGEELVLRDMDLADIDTVSYNSELGAKGDGNSLQKVDGNWIAQKPTPGVANTEQSASVLQDNVAPAKPAPTQDTTFQQSTSVLWTDEKKIFTRVKDMNKVVIVGAGVIFSGEALGFEKEFLNNARYLWTFGDGGTKEGEKVLHSYNYPGKYVVILNTSSGKYSASDRIYMEVIPADIIISSVGIGLHKEAFVEVQNNTKYELDLSGWMLRAGSKFFTIPKNTIILRKNKIIFSGEYTKFDIKKDYIVELLYPNNNVVFSYIWMSDVSEVFEVKSEKIEVSSIQESIVGESNKVETKKTTKEKPEQKRIIVKTEEIKPVIDFAKVNDRQVAVVSNTDIIKEDGIYKWISAVMGLVIISIFTFIMVKKDQRIEFDILYGESKSRVSYNEKKESDGYEIETI